MKTLTQLLVKAPGFKSVGPLIEKYMDSIAHLTEWMNKTPANIPEAKVRLETTLASIGRVNDDRYKIVLQLKEELIEQCGYENCHLLFDLYMDYRESKHADLFGVTLFEYLIREALHSFVCQDGIIRSNELFYLLSPRTYPFLNFTETDNIIAAHEEFGKIATATQKSFTTKLFSDNVEFNALCCTGLFNYRIPWPAKNN